MVELLYMKGAGIYGIATEILARMLIMFFIFSAVLHATHTGELFINIANAVAGRFSGGPAKVAVIASGAVGTASGSAVANVLTTGPFTIPMMKRVGFKPDFAAAVEAVASTGGQLMPPVMGAAAFLIASFMGVSYFNVMAAAAVPAVCYYLCVFSQVHAVSAKMGLRGLPREEIPAVIPSLAAAWPIVLSLVILVWFLSQGYNVGKCGMYAAGVLFVTSFCTKRTRVMKPSTVLATLEYGGRLTIGVGVPIAAVGVIIGTFTASGLSTEIARLIHWAGGGQLMPIALLTGVVGIILGMGLPTTIIYITLYMIALPALIEAGANPMAAHLLCFYFAAINAITPPVALASYAAAGLADAPIMSTSIIATRLAVSSFLVPLAFILDPAIVLEGSPMHIIFASLFALIGCLHLGFGIERYQWRKIGWGQQILLIVASLACLAPIWSVRAAGLGLIALSYVTLYVLGRVVPPAKK